MDALDPASVDRLTRWLLGRLTGESAEAVRDVGVSDLRGAGVGQSSGTLLFEATWSCGGRRDSGRFVLRRQPAAGGIFLRPDVVREFRILEGLARASAVPVPPVRWVEPDPAVLGTPFLVMDAVDGVVPSGKPSIHAVGWLPTLSPGERHTAWQSGIDAVAALHAVDWRAAHAFLAPGDGDRPGLDAHLRETVRWYGWATGRRSYPVTDAALAHLLQRRGTVRHSETVLVWGDARLGNTMFDPRTGTVVALLDWENATLAPAELDVAHWLVFDEFATVASGVQPLPGYASRAEIIDRYEMRSGRRLGDLDYFEILQCLFLATTLIRQADAHVRAGRLPEGTRMGHDNAVTQMLARRLGLPVPPLSADYLQHRGAPAGSAGIPAPTT
ncbi:MAG: phosphotransferase family protein [Frankiales bacterium]|nr:phosphotransferase family protein [Frankiales bacterium]